MKNIKSREFHGFFNSIKAAEEQDEMMHHLWQYNVTHCHVMMFSLCENDATFANPLGEADIIHEVNIISDSDIICRKANIIPKIKASLSTCLHSEIPNA